MERIGRLVTMLATLLASLLMSAVSAGSALAAGVPPYVGSGTKGGKGIQRGPEINQALTDWTGTIMLFAILVAAGVFLVALSQLRQRNARRRAALTPTIIG